MTIVKICGITSLADALAAVDAGADMLGFNFYPPSPRSITPEACSSITAVLNRDFPSVTLVGVFVNMPVQRVWAILQECSLKFAQLHGDETPEMLAALPGIAYKAFRGIPETEILDGYILQKVANQPAFLVDAAVKGLYGGSGVTADWFAAAMLSQKYSILLAGGLQPGNVAEAVEQVKPWGVDTASGVESSPGRKDEGKIRDFVQAVRATAL